MGLDIFKSFLKMALIFQIEIGPICQDELKSDRKKSLYHQGLGKWCTTVFKFHTLSFGFQCIDLEENFYLNQTRKFREDELTNFLKEIATSLLFLYSIIYQHEWAIWMGIRINVQEKCTTISRANGAKCLEKLNS